MKYRKLRIALSVMCGLVAVLLCVLWVRSYQIYDNVVGPPHGSYRFGVASAGGWLTIRWKSDFDPSIFPRGMVQTKSAEQMEAIYRQMEDSIRNDPGTTYTRPTFKFGSTGDGAIQFQYWLPAMIAAALAAAAWLRWRFSLRTLLIGMTLLAVGLGWLVYTLRN